MTTNRGGELTLLVRKIAIWTGVAILIVSIWLSFDGFDGAVNGGANTPILGKVIGLTFAVAVTVMQFIFTSDYKRLNATLKVVGILSYVYSIYTNMLGAVSLLNMNQEMAWITAIFADIVAEPMIAWGMGEEAVGNLLGNLGMSFRDTTGLSSSSSRPISSENMARLPKSNNPPQAQNRQQNQQKPAQYSPPSRFKTNGNNPQSKKPSGMFDSNDN